MVSVTKDPTHSLPLHIFTCLVHELDCVFVVLAVDEHGARQTHCKIQSARYRGETWKPIEVKLTELTQKWSPLELPFGHDRSSLWEYSTEIQDVQEAVPRHESIRSAVDMSSNEVLPPSPLMVSDENRALRTTVSCRQKRCEMLLPIHLETNTDEWRADVVERSSSQVVDVETLPPTTDLDKSTAVREIRLGHIMRSTLTCPKIVPKMP